MIFDNNIRKANCLDNRKTILEIEAPLTFLIAISFVLRATVSKVNPNKPEHAINIANMEAYLIMLFHRFSDLYCAASLSSRNVYEKGWSGTSVWNFSFMIAIVS
jgi:hypothetical protein